MLQQRALAKVPLACSPSACRHLRAFGPDRASSLTATGDGFTLRCSAAHGARDARSVQRTVQSRVRLHTRFTGQFSACALGATLDRLTEHPSQSQEGIMSKKGIVKPHPKAIEALKNRAKSGRHLAPGFHKNEAVN